MKKKVGIFGGSFNPVHIGHVSLAKNLLEGGLLDELWMMVSPLNPLKTGAGNIIDFDRRLDMARIAVEGIPGLKVSDFERELPVPSYTVDTLSLLEKHYPECQFCLVIGADNWTVFDKWYRYKDILQRYEVLVYSRPGSDLADADLPEGVKLVEMELYDVSSTDIRRKIKQGEDVSQLLPEGVLEYIKENGLYLS